MFNVAVANHAPIRKVPHAQANCQSVRRCLDDGKRFPSVDEHRQE